MDIVERLRNNIGGESYTYKTISEAADEIERLRDALRWAAPYVKDDPRVSAIIKATLKEEK